MHDSSKDTALLVSTPGIVQEATTAMLKSLPQVTKVQLASGALSAIEWLRNEDAFVLVVDANIPAEEAELLVRWAKQHRPETRCIVLARKMDEVKELASRERVTIHDRLPKTTRDNRSSDTKKKTDKNPFCTLPWTSIFVNASNNNGGIFPHCGCQKEAGNIHADRLLDIWNNDTMVAYRRNMLNGDFGFCAEDCIKGMVDSSILNVGD